jgi:serine/threonine-protein kinase
MAKKIKEEYEITGELGSGGMATVYKAVQRSLGRPVAIKELKKSFHDDPTIVQRFEREARLAASFQHENIVHIYDFCQLPEFCIVMEYVDGVTLSQVLDTTGPLPIDVGVMIGLQVASALEYAHRRGLIHRDIKPGNIMIKRNGEVKLMDFGIARTRGLDALTQPGTLVGTPSYMSPEQAVGEPLDVRSDIFSLGVVLYEMFTGAKPFQDEATRSIVAKIVEARYIPPRSINSDLPRSIQGIIKKCLRKKPHRRFASMQELGRALGKRIRGMDKAASLKRISDFLVRSGLVETPPEDETVVIYQAPGMGTFTKMLLVSGGVLMVLAVAIGAFTWSRMGAPSGLPQTGTQVRTVPSDTVSQPTPTLSTGSTVSVPPSGDPDGR